MPYKNRLTSLKIVLGLGGAYYAIGAAAHFFGLTVFPFYDGRLYTPYHDTLIALASFIISLFTFTIARDPEKNVDMLDALIIAAGLAVFASIYILMRIDFTLLGAPDKKFQTVVETILLALYTNMLIALHPKRKR